MQTVRTNQADGPYKQNDQQNTGEALKHAEKDIKNDPDLSPKPDPAAEVDEGQLARPEGED